MFDIPFELFALFMGLALVFVPIGLVTRKQGIGYMIMFTTGLFIAVMAITTDNIIMDTFQTAIGESVLYHYNIEQSTGVSSISGLTNPQVRGEYVFSTSSQLYGDTIDCIDIYLRKSGTPTELAVIGIFDHAQADSDPLILSFGSQPAGLLQTYSEWKTYCLPVGQTYTIGDQDVIGISYKEVSTVNIIQMSTVLVDVFDGSTTEHSSQSSSTFAWSNFATVDSTMRMYLRSNEGIIVSDSAYPFTEMPKTLFVILGGFVIFAGAMLLVKDS